MLRSASDRLLGFSRRHANRSSPSGRLRRLSFEPLEARQLLSVGTPVVPGPSPNLAPVAQDDQYVVAVGGVLKVDFDGGAARVVGGGELLVTDGSTVGRYDGATGQLLGTLVSALAGMSDALAMTLGPNGDLFVQSYDATAVHRYDGRTGEYLGRFTQGVDLANPRDLVFGPDGDLYVTNTGTNQVYRFDGKTGQFLGPFGFGHTLRGPIGLCFGPDGNLYVSSYLDDNVARFSGTTGQFIDVFASGGGLDSPQQVGFAPDGNLYVIGQMSRAIHRYDGTTGQFLGLFTTAFINAQQMIFERDGNMVVGEYWDVGYPGIYRVDAATGERHNLLVAVRFNGGLVRTEFLPPAGVLRNDSDPDFDPISAVLVARPAHGTLIFNGDGSFLYAPEAGFLGTDQFTYRARDGFGGTSTATVSIEVGPDLGPVDFCDLPGLDPSTGDLWYTFQSVRPGFVSARASVPTGTGDFTVTLYDAAGAEVASATASGGVAQADAQADAAGEKYSVRLRGSTGNVDLRVANLVRRVGSQVTVAGTPGPDLFQCVVTPTRKITINGVGYEFDPAAVGAIVFSGNGGTDAAALTGATGSESLRMEPGAAALRGTGLSVDVAGTESIVVDGGGGTSTARLYDSPRDDAFTARPGDCTLSSDAYLLRAVGFRYVWAYATAGGHDRATLDGSPGNDVFLGDLAKGYAVSYGSGFYHRAESFDSVTARSAGGVDMARLYDGPQDDTLRTGPTETSLAGPAQEFHAEGFRYVAVYSAAGGSDEALLFDSPAADSFTATPTYGTLSGGTFSNTARGFRSVRAFATPGADDVARLYDSPGNDSFDASPTSATLQVGNGPSATADHFRFVYAYATAGGYDSAVLSGSAGPDTFVGYPTYAALYGAGFYNRANYFDAVRAVGAGGNDLARLYGSAGDDALETHPEYALLAGPGFSLRADGFPSLIAYAGGGNDTARLFGGLDADTLTGTYDYTRLVGIGFDQAAYGFKQVFAGGGGGRDVATLYDSPGSDRLEAAGSRERLSYADRQIEVTGFYRVKAISSRGGHDTFHLDAVDFLFLLQGPWFYG